jgi:hypothetical protein
LSSLLALDKKFLPYTDVLITAVSFEVIMIMSVNIVVLWDLTPWSSVEQYKWFGGT